MLDAGIDVYSTVNVQHLESLNDQVAELTGVRVRETFPDQVLAAADEVVLMDLTPEALIQRLREGKVYPQDRVPTALGSFFRMENLPRCARSRCARWPRTWRPSGWSRPPRRSAPARSALFGEAPQPVAERVLALVSARRARPARWSGARGARPSGSAAELDLLYVAPPGAPPRGRSASSSRRCAGSRRSLGAALIVEEGDDVAEAAGARGRASAARPTCSSARRARPAALRRFEESLPERLLRKLPGVDMRIVADRAERRQTLRVQQQLAARPAALQVLVGAADLRQR